jgi:hypothetical protein
VAARRKTAPWYGFLEAGDRSSPVVRDPSLDTGNPTTVYLFNLMKNRILEYRRDIVEAKLRPLTPEESALRKDLKKAFAAQRESFKPSRVAGTHSPGRVRVSRAPEDDELPSFDDEQPWTPDDGEGMEPIQLDAGD